MGQKSEVFCRQAISVLAQNPQIVPPSLHVADAQADLLALDRLRPVLERLQKLRRARQRHRDRARAAMSWTWRWRVTGS